MAPQKLLRIEMTPEDVSHLPFVLEVRLMIHLGAGVGLRDVWGAILPGEEDVVDAAAREMRSLTKPGTVWRIDSDDRDHALGVVVSDHGAQTLIHIRHMSGEQAIQRYRHHLDVEYPSLQAALQARSVSKGAP